MTEPVAGAPIDASRARGKVDFGIVTIRDDEFRAVLRRFPDRLGLARGRREYNLRALDLGGGQRYVVAVIRCVEQGNGEAQSAARDLLEDLDPGWLLVVGIAGGMPAHEFGLGDVVVSTRICDFSVEAVVGQHGREYALGGGPIHHRAAAIAANLPAHEDDLAGWASPAKIDVPRPPLPLDAELFYGDPAWRTAVRDALAGQAGATRDPIFVTGAIASSDRLIKDAEIMLVWSRIARQVLCVEMESAGVYRAAHGRASEVPFLAIRGISDVVGYRRSQAWTRYACETAAAFTRAFLTLRPAEPRMELDMDATTPLPPPVARLPGEAPLRVYCVYHRVDEPLVGALDAHLNLLRRDALIGEVVRRRIEHDGGGERASAELADARIILFFVSADFLASDYAVGEEVRRALTLHGKRRARVMPVLLRPVDWSHASWADAPLNRLTALPRDGRPVTTWPNKDEAWLSVAKSLKLVAEELGGARRHSSVPPPSARSARVYPIHEVFRMSGVPDVTFVEPVDFQFLKLALAHPGRGVVLEGPSGVGKTTALRKAIEQLAGEGGRRDFAERVTVLSTRNREDVARLRDIARWHEGTVAVDDVHRLDKKPFAELVDYLKMLADSDERSKKLVLIGIPRAGQALVDLSFDVATRIGVFRLGRVTDDMILQMIERGEQAMNISFDRRSDIALASAGSLNIAQFLCYYVCTGAKVLETAPRTVMVRCDIESVVSRVMADLARKFAEPVRKFAALGGARDMTALRLLEVLAKSEDGFLSLPRLKEERPELAPGIERFLDGKWMQRLFREAPDVDKCLFFDASAMALVVEDPQLAFYLSRTHFGNIARSAGKGAMVAQRRVLVSYSRYDHAWLEPLRDRLRAEGKGEDVDVREEQIRAGVQWRQEIKEHLETATAVVLLISDDYLSSNEIIEDDLALLLSRAAARGAAIVPLLVSPSRYAATPLGRFVALNPEAPVSALSPAEQEQLFSAAADVALERKRASG